MKRAADSVDQWLRDRHAANLQAEINSAARGTHQGQPVLVDEHAQPLMRELEYFELRCVQCNVAAAIVATSRYEILHPDPAELREAGFGAAAVEQFEQFRRDHAAHGLSAEPVK
jgi:hypothetical protein